MKLLLVFSIALWAQTSNPQLVRRIEPQYSEEARKAKWPGGTVKVKIHIDAKGLVRAVDVLEHPGMGIDGMTVEALKKWEFIPAMKDGEPVATTATVEVNFKSW
ncbi:MAG: energy transducer TonB [Acidobacteria bacterium]|nr:energy transducer TonB [Acidobacteriota bacterium]